MDEAGGKSGVLVKSSIEEFYARSDCEKVIWQECQQKVPKIPLYSQECQGKGNRISPDFNDPA